MPLMINTSPMLGTDLDNVTVCIEILGIGGEKRFRPVWQFGKGDLASDMLPDSSPAWLAQG